MKSRLIPVVVTILLSFIINTKSRAEIATYFDQPDTGYISNVVIDMIEHNGGIWFGTGEGLNYSFDSGQTWLFYDTSNGLVSSNLSAMLSIATATGQRLWIATNHEGVVAGFITPISDGVSFSDDDGQTWTQIDFSQPPNDIDFVWGGDRIIYDITGHYDITNPAFDDWLFFSAFAGGFLASRDGGMSWRRIFPSSTDSAQFYSGGQPSLRNRYFSCEVDTSYGDSLIVWAGSAGGAFQYTFAEPKDKFYQTLVNEIAFCDSCGQGGENYVYLGGIEGLTRGSKSGRPYVSRFESDGLLGGEVTALLAFGGKLFAGTIDPLIDDSEGLQVSDDFGDSFSPVSGFSQAIGINNRISDLARLGDRIYLAGEEAGLFVSNDTGATWIQIYADTSDTTASNRRNVVHALEAWGDTLRVGTDSGLVQLFMNPAGNIDSSRYYVFPESDSSGASVVGVRTQLFQGAEVLWTINRPTTGLGTRMIGRSADGGMTFQNLRVGYETNEVNFLGDTVIVVGEGGARFASDAVDPDSVFYIDELVSGEVVESMTEDSLLSIEVLGDTILIGGENGYAYSLDRGETYNVVRRNGDSLAADQVLLYSSAIDGISGDFIPALGVQYVAEDTVTTDSSTVITNFSRVWMSCRPTFSGFEGISVGVMAPVVDTLDRILGFTRIWGNLHDRFAWNFAFAGDTVFAATNDGLIYGSSDSLIFDSTGLYDWQMLDLRDSAGYALILPGTPVYAVEVTDNYIWIGTDDRTVRVDRGDLSKAVPFFVVDATTPADEVYAFPVPFSFARNQVVEFHFTVEQTAAVTLEIYDFAMNLVKRVIDGETFQPGIYPTAGYGRRTWNGINGKGDEVAIGVYYFKVEYSTGETHWGKLAVIP